MFCPGIVGHIEIVLHPQRKGLSVDGVGLIHGLDTQMLTCIDGQHFLVRAGEIKMPLQIGETTLGEAGASGRMVIQEGRRVAGMTGVEQVVLLQPGVVIRKPAVIAPAGMLPVIPGVLGAFSVHHALHMGQNVITVGSLKALGKIIRPGEIIPGGSVFVVHHIRENPTVIRIGEEAHNGITKKFSHTLFIFFIDKLGEQLTGQRMLKGRETPVHLFHI